MPAVNDTVTTDLQRKHIYVLMTGANEQDKQATGEMTQMCFQGDL